MKPILFSTPMVQAILAGRKTMTRRVVGEDKRGEWIAFNDVRENSKEGATVPCYLNREISIDDKSRNIMYPKYDIGDILWVRETWCKNGDAYLYKAECPYLQNNMWVKWRPSIFMPKEICRLFLKVTNVRTERLQDITEDDAMNEGTSAERALKIGGKQSTVRPNYRDAFSELWDGINVKRGYGWDTNPFVWVIEFERVEDL